MHAMTLLTTLLVCVPGVPRERPDPGTFHWRSEELVEFDEPVRDVVDVATRVGHHMVLRADGTIISWGRNDRGQAEEPDDLPFIVDVAAGAWHSVALGRNGEVYTWGWDGDGRLDVPDDLHHVVAIAAGDYHTVALRSNGTVVSWGMTVLGDPTPPAGLRHVVAIATGPTQSLALLRDGTVVAWGDDNGAETHVPPGLDNVVAIAAGPLTSMALRNDGTVVHWGADPARMTPPKGLRDVIGIAVGDFVAYASHADGSFTAWGIESKARAINALGLCDVIRVAADGLVLLIIRDRDADGFCDSRDYCPDSPTDEVVDDIGCAIGEFDADLDGYCDGPHPSEGLIACVEIDNCPLIWNPLQTDADADGDGDACDRCPGSVDRDFAELGECAFGLTGIPSSEGCSAFDQVDACLSELPSGGKSTSCLRTLAASWAREGFITRDEQSEFIDCATSIKRASSSGERRGGR